MARQTDEDETIEHWTQLMESMRSAWDRAGGVPPILYQLKEMTAYELMKSMARNGIRFQ
jgi:hypothetical protein